MKNHRITRFLTLALAGIVFTASPAFAQKNDRKAFGKGNPFTIEELPAGKLKEKLQTLDPQARGKAMQWLHTFSFPGTDAAESLRVDKEGGIYYGCSFSCAGCKSGEHGKSAHDEASADTSGVPEADSTETAEPTSNSKVALEPDTENGLPLEDDTASWTPSGTVSIANPPVFSSKPGAPNVIYLDFNGGIVSGTAWNGTVTSFDTLAWSRDTDRTAFSASEQVEIRQIWERMAEDFAPFDVNVTTDTAYDPDIYTGNRSRVAWCLFTPSKDRNGVSNPHDGYGGIAYVGVFGRTDYAYYSPAWNQDYGQANAAEVGSHEIGHNLGLSHDGLTTGATYYGGHAAVTGVATSWGPIMGTGYGRNVSQWSKASEYYNGNQTQDDFSVVSARIPYRADDHGNTFGTATPWLSGTVDQAGIIERTNDIDTFTFDAGAGTISLNAATYRSAAGTWGGNLDILLELYDNSGNLIASHNPAVEVNASISASVPAGRYYVMLKPTGAGNPLSSTPSGYTAYGSVGQYRITGNFTPESVPGSLAVTPAGGLSASGTYGGTFTPSSLQYTLSNPGTTSINWTASNTQSWVTLSATSGTLAAGASTTVTASINGGASSLDAGNYGDTVTFTNTTNGTGNATRPVSLTINKASQTITFGALASVSADSTPFALTATASSGLTVSYTSSNPAVATVSGNTVTIVGAGSTTITASQTGNINYNAATPVQQSLTVTPADGAPVTALADGETTNLGTVSMGSFSDTWASNNSYQVLTESLSGGNPKNRRSQLEHVWTFNVAPGELVTFYVEAYHTANTEGDNFRFAYSTDGTNYTDMVTVTKTSDDNVPLWHALPGDLRGVVYVRVVDTDRTAGRTSLESLYVDHLTIVSESASSPPGLATNPSPADGATGISVNRTLGWEPAEWASSHDVYFGTTPVFQGNQTTTTFNPGTLVPLTTYYWRVDEVNNLGTTTGSVWSFTTAEAAPEMYVSAITLGVNKRGRNYQGVATVNIVNASTGQPVAGATVTGDFTGAFGETASAVTDSAGNARVLTSAKKALPLSFTFTVTNVTDSVHTYRPTLNIVTSASGSF